MTQRLSIPRLGTSTSERKGRKQELSYHCGRQAEKFHRRELSKLALYSVLTTPLLQARDCYFYLLRWYVSYVVAAVNYYGVVWTLVEVGLREPTMIMYEMICLVQMKALMLEENVRMHLVLIMDLLHL